MIGNGRYRGKTPDVAASVSDLTHDVIELSELQVQLLSLDASQTMNRAKSCILLAAVGASLLLGTIPIALLAISAVLVEQWEWTYAAATGLATLLGVLLAAIVLGVAFWYVKSGLVSFERSREELQRNITWVKSTLKNRGRSSGTVAHPTDRALNF